MGEPGTEEVHLNEEVQLVMDQRRRETYRRVMNRSYLTIVFHQVSLQVIPPTCIFPIITCKQLVNNWYVGNNREKIPPLEVLSALYLAHLGNPGDRNSRKLKLIQMRCVMVTLDKYAKKEN